jgi:transcriptional regulator with XRE-family HTH domain
VAAGLITCPKWTISLIYVHNGKMPSKPPIVFPQEQTLLTALGERLRLARLRRKLSTAVVAQRAGMSRTSVYKVEAGDAGATLGTYLRVLAVLGLQADFNALAADDKVGRKLQDLALAPSPSERRRRRASTQSTVSANSTSEVQP